MSIRAESIRVPKARGSEPIENPTRTGPSDAVDPHASAIGRHLDIYLAAVARELQDRGVITGSPQRTDPDQRLLGSIVLDCTALRVAAWEPGDQESVGAAIHPERPTPVIVTWDEDMGWCAGMHHGPTLSSRRYLHADLLPAPAAVADFVVGLALGEQLGAACPIADPAPGRPRLRVVR